MQKTGKIDATRKLNTIAEELPRIAILGHQNIFHRVSDELENSKM
jgi:hypothetical protein